MENPVYYSAKDSIYADLKTKIVSLYGEAQVDYDQIQLTADYIEIDLEKKEVLAMYTLDADSNRVGIPKFTDGTEEFTAAAIRYNFETEKGYIQELKTKQEENYLYMEVAKKQSNGEIHFRQGQFTTCELDDPHYHFQLSKAVLVPEKRIVTGPMNLWIKGVPTPLGLPFSLIPTNNKTKKNGILFPELVPLSAYGFGVNDLGYYLPINDNLETTFFASLYSRGSFGISNRTNYKKRYKYTGGFELGFNLFKQPFPSDFESQKLTVVWSHSQEQKANPYWRFSSKVNFISDNSPKQNLDPLNPIYFNNTINSDINLTRSFPGKPYSAGLKAGLKQNSITGIMSLTLPSLNFNASRFYPLKVLRTDPIGGAKWYEKIGMTYNMNAENKASFQDTLLRDKDFENIGNQFLNGVRHAATLTTAVPLFKGLATLTPSVNYNMRWNSLAINKNLNTTTQLIETDTVRGFGFSHDLTTSVSLTTALYSYYQFIGKSKAKLRHVMTPNISFSYTPDLSSAVTKFEGVDSLEFTYSPFENSLYREGFLRETAILSYGLNNTFELKTKAKNDTTQEFKRTRLIDALSFRGNYNFQADSMNFSNISTSLRVSPVKSLSVVVTGSYSIYGWSDSTGASIAEFATVNNGRLGRFEQVNVTTGYTFASKESRDKIDENQELFSNYWEADFQYYALNPSQIIDYSIPWKATLSHTFYSNVNKNITDANRTKYLTTQTLSLSGDMSFTKRWKVAFSSNYDLIQKKLVQTNVSLNRDMHCWQLAFTWIPIGGNQSFVFRLNSTSNLFRDAKLELRKPPLFL